MTDTALAGLLDAIPAAPPLERGRCIDQWDLFDATDDPAAVELAIQLCQECPVLNRCREWVDSLPKSKRPIGVCGGVVNTPPKTRKKAQ